MSIKIGFLVHRKAYYKHFGPLIDEALRRGHQVFCFHDYAKIRQQGKKAYQFASLDKLPRFSFGKPAALAFNGHHELIEKVKKNKVQVLVSLCFPVSYVELRRSLSEAGIFFATLQSVGDSLIDAELWTCPDAYLVYSLFWVDLAVEYLLKRKIIAPHEKEASQRRLREKSVVVGFTELEQRKMLEREQLKKDWGIPQDKKVVLLLPFTFNSSGDRFWRPFVYGNNNLFVQLILVLFYPVLYPLLAKRRPGLRQWLAFFRQVFKRENDIALMRALKKFCQKNNAYFLVKARKKDPVKPYLAELADKVLYDEEFYPATIIKCLRIADLCCNFYSSAGMEASLMGVPNVCIAPTFRDWADVQHPLWEVLFSKAKDLHDFPGVSYKLSISEAIRAFSEKTLADFPLDKEKQKKHVKKYVGPLDGEYSAKAVNVMESLVNRGKKE